MLAEAEEPFVSVVVTTLNAARYLTDCLDALVDLDYPKDHYEVVIVDAFSTDGTPEIVQRYAGRHPQPEIRLFQKRGTIGVGRNEGVRRARGRFIAVTDGDVRVSRPWLRELLQGFTWSSGVAAVGGPNNSATGGLASRTVSCIPVHGPSLEVVPLVGRNRYRRRFLSRTDWYTNVTRGSMFRRDALEEVGGFREDLISTEDPELNERLHRAGYWTAYNPAAVVYHHHRDSLAAFYRQMRWYAYGHGDTTRKAAYMRRPKQFLPCAVSLGAVTLLALAPFSALAARLLTVGVAGSLAVLGWYGAKCAITKRDARLLWTAPLYFLAWQWAWALEYPRALLGLPAPGLADRRSGV